ncbi:DAN domain [Nesidiocoris tenuis]|uniref:DAN domain n=1 Tax=Nesidiocoris tenuis TaxID=355587 RepID=A0ABN7AIC0_9HEMI|nr:DAN domain [Nesidiocoris tenuis]
MNNPFRFGIFSGHRLKEPVSAEERLTFGPRSVTVWLCSLAELVEQETYFLLCNGNQSRPSPGKEKMIRSLLALAFFHIASSHREHKVHNIVLYPEKHSWCKTTPIKEVVGHPGCEAIEVDNNVCVGACFSYSIPRTEPTAPGEVASYCDSCQPSRVVWKQVTLTCPENDNETMIKRVEVIENCSCLTCRPRESEQTDTNEASAVDVPSILNIMSAPLKTGNSSHIKHGSKLGQLLKMLAGADEDTADGLDGKTTEERLENLIEEMRSKGVNEEELQGLAEKSEGTGQVKVDLNKLKLLLSRIEGDQEGNSSEDNEDEEETLDLTPQRARPHRLPHEHTKVPTLEVAPHHLRPTVEGEELTYLPQHNHHHRKTDDLD